jgi:hypothetical protein
MELNLQFEGELFVYGYINALEKSHVTFAIRDVISPDAVASRRVS